MQYALCTDCGISQAGITKMIGLYNHSKYGDRMRHIPENGHRWYIISFVSHFCSSSAWPKTYQDYQNTHFSKGILPIIGKFLRNIIGRLVQDTMTDSPVRFTIFPNIISWNPSSHMVVPFQLVLIHLQEKCQQREKKGGQIEINIFQELRKT